MSDERRFSAIVLAAGQGTRMKSQRPKVLHGLMGKPMVSYPVEAALAAGAERVVAVVGHAADAVTEALAARYPARVSTALQPEQRGTGDAARCGVEALAGFAGELLVVNGDAPLLPAALLGELVDAMRRTGTRLGLVTSSLPDATGYGRIIRDAGGAVVAVREQRDCSAEEQAITEWNPGVYVIDADFFRAAVATLTTDNAQGELYITDLIAIAARDGGVAEVVADADLLHGVNDRAQLVQCERLLRLQILSAHARAGVTIRAPESTFVDADVTLAPDVTLEAGVQLRGRCDIASGCHIDVGSVLTDVRLGPGTRVLPYTVATDSRVGGDARLGPFSHLRPGSDVGDEVHLGNFVETKKTRLERGAKANHLAYLGDGDIGEGANVGAGTIFCNYDGFNKHRTVLEAGVFIGSDSQLVAPVRVGKNAYVASGTTVTMDVPEDALAIGRARQANKPDLGARLRARLQAQKAAAQAAKKG